MPLIDAIPEGDDFPPLCAMMGCGGRKKSQHFANSLEEIQSFILIKASFSVIIHEGSLRI